MTRTIRTILSTTILSAFCLPGGAFAEMAVDEEFIVTATRNAQPRERIGSSVSVIDSIEIERRQYSFVRDALTAMPGVTVDQSGVFGGFAGVRLRGLRAEQTLVLIDGIKVNDPSSPSGGFDFGTMEPSDVERIEVLKGPQSTLYGSDAIGGVINVITKRGREGFSLNGFVEGGSHETLRGGLTASGGDGRLDYRVTASGITSDGISKADKRDGNTEKDGYENASLSANLGFQASESLRLEAFARHSDSDFDYDGFGMVTGVEDADQRSRNKETSLNARALVSLYDGRFENIIALGYHDIGRDSFAAGVFDFGSDGRRLSASYQGNVTLREGTMLTFGAETLEDEIDTATEQAQITMDSLFAQAQVLLFDTLTLTGGLRHDDHSGFGGHTTLRTTAAYSVASTGTILRASWGEGFKAPTPFQLTFFCCGAAGPNMDLEPEETRGWDIGLEQSFWNRQGQFSVTWFHQTTDNLIDFDFATSGYINIHQTRSRGLEVALALDPAPWISVDLNYTHLSAIDRTTQVRLVRVPKDKGSLTLTLLPTDRLTISGTGHYNGQETDSWGIVDDWIRLDLRAGYRLTDRFELFARVENLLDEHYQEVFGYGTPGLSAYAGIRGRF